MRYDLDLYDVSNMLEFGYFASRKRKKEIVEKWFDKGNKTYNAVIGKDYN